MPTSLLPLLRMSTLEPQGSGFHLLADRAELPGHKVIGRPGAANDDLTVLQLPGCGRIAVLVLHDGLLIDEMGNVKLHGAGIDFAATDFLLERREELVNLH